MQIFAFAASLRSVSLLIQVATAIAESEGADVDLAEFTEFEMPLYDGDLDQDVGLPPGAEELRERIDRVDAVMIAAPEYNYSLSGVLKNAVDCVSRARPMPWRGRSVYLMSASPGAHGGVRGLWQTRIPLEACGALVFPDMFALGNAHLAFDERGHLIDLAASQRLERELVGFIRLAEVVAPLARVTSKTSDAERAREIEAALEDESELQPQS